MAFGVYVHVPFCASRCGYCDFNTYTATELGGGGSISEFRDVLALEFDVAAPTLAGVRVDTVFFGGGTPTMLSAEQLAGILDDLRTRCELADDAEITTECNPDSVDEPYLRTLRAAGFTRISIGMQSSAPSVLATLERTHTPGRAIETAKLARDVGFEHVSLDLIYGTPGESNEALRQSVDDALSADPDHLSAYSLIIEPGTRMGAKRDRGELSATDDDVLAEKYLLVDEALTQAGYAWYEVSNWARPGGECRHNLGYWRSDPWWGFGPGAHSFIGVERWWNLKHPRAYAAALREGGEVRAGRESLTAHELAMERVMLELRLATGVQTTILDAQAVADHVVRGNLTYVDDRAVLTQSGRLLADAIVRDVLTSPS